MESKSLTPEESLELISEVISEARYRIKEDGFIYVMWGVLITIAGLGQFLLIHYDQHSISYYPYFLMPVGAVISFVYYWRKPKRELNTISRLVGWMWGMISINVLLLGFVFAGELRENLVPIILIFIGVGTVVSGSTLRDKLIFACGLLINLLGLACFYIDWYYHSLAIAATGFFLMLIPGIMLAMKNRK